MKVRNCHVFEKRGQIRFRLLHENLFQELSECGTKGWTDGQDGRTDVWTERPTAMAFHKQECASKSCNNNNHAKLTTVV